MELIVGDSLLAFGLVLWKTSTGLGTGMTKWTLTAKTRKYGGLTIGAIGLIFVTHAWLIR